MSNLKTIIIVRHGKSDWSFRELSDIDRPLKTKGIINAYEMASRLKNKEIIPDLILSSPANRALYTAIVFARVIEVSLSKFKINEELYSFHEENIIEIIKNTTNEIDSLMIFGHNPAFTNFANKYLINKIDNIPTTGVVVINFSCDKWKDISRQNVKSEYYDFPKNK